MAGQPWWQDKELIAELSEVVDLAMQLAEQRIPAETRAPKMVAAEAAMILNEELFAELLGRG